MSQHFVVQLVDDLNGEVAQETVRFSLDGVQYVIDLTDRHASELRQHLAPFIDHARQQRSGAANARQAAAPVNPRQAQVVRDWARENGYKPNSRGRISKPIMDAFIASQRRAGR